MDELPIERVEQAWCTYFEWYKGHGPVGYRVGRHLRYRREAVEGWLEQQADQR